MSNHPRRRYKDLLTTGNGIMITATITTLITIVICYTHDELFSMGKQVIGHIVMLMAITSIKMGYLMRCVARHYMGAKQL